MNTPATLLPIQTIANLGQIALHGQANSGSTDTVMVATANGNVQANNQDSILALAQGWSGAEYNLVGDCCASEAYFNNVGSQIVVRLSVNNGTTNPPTYTTSFLGATAETNNLNLVGSPTTVGGASPAIVFSENGGGPIPPGISIGDTHLITFNGVHYDLQASGDFVLVQADPDFVVQTRQKAYTPPSVSVNTEVGTRMGSNRVAVCLSGLVVNGTRTQLNDGASLALSNGVVVARRSNTYVVSRPTGDIVQAQILGGYIDVSVVLGITNPSTVRGLLGNPNKEQRQLVMRDGTVLKEPFSFATFTQYADSWRIDPKESLLCGDGPTEHGMPTNPTYAENLPAQERERVRAICSRAGVKDPLLDDCSVDVSLFGNPSAADVFVYAPTPVKAVRPH